MHYKIVKRADIAEDFLPMNEIQDHARFDGPYEEELLVIYRDAAIDFAERYMNRAIGVHTVRACLDKYKQRVYLPLGDVQSVLSVQADGDDITYKTNLISNQVILDNSAVGKNDIVIEYTVGQEVDDIPKAIKLGCLKLIATWSESREDVSFGVAATEVPFNHRACFDLYRIPVGG